MHKKIISVLAAMLLIIGGSSTCAAAVDGSELLTNGSFEEISGGTIVGDQFVNLTGVTLDTVSPAKDGFNSLRMPSSSGGFQIRVRIEGNSNYILSFWTKTGMQSSVKVLMYCYVSHNGVWYEYGQYCREAGIPYIRNVEGVLEAYCGTKRETGDAVWEKNSFEVRIPHDVTHVVFYVSANGKDDPLRAFDDFSFRKTRDNLVLNGGFEESYSTVPGVYTPNQYRMASIWYVHPSDHYDGHYTYEEDENGNHYILMEDSGNTDHTWRGLVLQQRVWLYEGVYKLNFKRNNFTSTGNMVTLTPEGSGVSTLGTGPHYLMNATNWRTTDGWEEYTVYFEVTTMDAFLIKFGNVWFPGKFAIDDVTLIQVTGTQAEFATDCTSYTYSADNVMDLKLNSTNAMDYGKSIRAHGVLLPRSSEAESAKVISVLYKVDGLRKTVVDIKTQTVATADGRMKPFCTEAIEVPLRERTETYVIKTLIWNAWTATAPYKVAVLK